MKAILEFNLEDPQDKYEHSNALMGSIYKDRIDTIYDEVFRPHLKYEKPIIGNELKEEHEEVLRAILNKILSHFHDKEEY